MFRHDSMRLFRLSQVSPGISICVYEGHLSPNQTKDDLAPPSNAELLGAHASLSQIRWCTDPVGSALK